LAVIANAAETAELIETAAQAVVVRLSIGVASTDICGYVLDDLLGEGDAAAYEAKATGRNRAVSAIASPTGLAARKRPTNSSAIIYG
jgi:PleD family two-component response regulator